MRVVVSSKYFINCLCFKIADNIPWLITCMYGSSTFSMSRYFWDSLDEIGNSFTRPWMVIGNFNIVLTSSNKCGGQTVASSSSGGLEEWLMEMD